MSSDWGRVARGSAAREFGRRHYKWFFAAEHLGGILGAALVLAGITGAGLGVWWALRHVSALVLCLALAGSGVVWIVLRVMWIITNGRAGSGRDVTVVALCIVGLVAAAIAVS